MIIDLTRLKSSIDEEVIIDEIYSFDKEYINNTDLLELNNVKIEGNISKDSLDELVINLVVKGIMVLPCSITLEPVNQEFNIEISGNLQEIIQEIEENDKKIENSIDILPIIWENILMEIPMRVVSDEAKNSDMKMEGEGWKFVTEEEEKTSPLSELLEYLDE